MNTFLEKRQQLFKLISFEVYCKTRTIGDAEKLHSHSLASVKIKVTENPEILTVAEGNGPVFALDLALRKALGDFYPEIAKFYLIDYRVEIPDAQSGTSAETRVLAKFSNSINQWEVEGVSPSIIEASYKAVVAGLEQGWFLHNQDKTKARALTISQD